MKKLLTSLTFLILLSSCKEPKPADSFPAESWEISTPEAEDVDKATMQQALDYLKSKSFEDGVEEVLIIRNGRVIYQADSVEKTHNIYSCSKAFTSTVLGLMVEDGMVKLDDKVSDYDPDLKELYPDATFFHFATMTSGYSGEGRSRWEDENSDWSLTPYTPAEPHFAPGTHYEYWDEAQMTFGKVLTRILQRPMKDYLTERLTSKIGLGDWRWGTEQSVDNIPINNGCTGVTINALQLARFGHLYLNRGNWNVEQIVVKQFTEMATSTQVSASIPVFEGDRANVKGSGSYGLNWWVNSEDGLSKMPDAPLGAAYLSGLNHNVCMIVPEWNMVIVRMGDDKNPPEGKHVVWNEFLKILGKGVE